MNKIIKFIKLPLIFKIERLRRKTQKINKVFYGGFGDNSIIQKPLLIYNRKKIFIGTNVTIRKNLRIEPIEKWGEKLYTPEIYIGNNSNIEQNCHITCANKVIIGSKVTILGYTCITDIVHKYEDINKGVLDQEIITYETVIEDECFIGMGSRIMAGVKIGKHSIIGTNSVVNKNVPEYSVVAGIPAKIIKKYNFETKNWEKV